MSKSPVDPLVSICLLIFLTKEIFITTGISGNAAISIATEKASQIALKDSEIINQRY